MQKKLLYALVLAVPPLLGGLYLYLYSVNLVMADEFGWARWAAGPFPPLSSLFYRHDAHIIFFPAVAYLALAKLTAANSVAACWLSFSLVVLLYLAVARFTFQHLPKTVALVICVLVGAALFHPSQRGNTLWGNQIGFYMTFVVSCFSLLAFAHFFRTERESEGSKLALAATICCAVVASFSSAQGIITWPALLCCWLCMAGKKAWRSPSFYFFCLVLILTCGEFAYMFRHYNGSALTTMLQRPSDAAEYFSSLLDNVCMTGKPPFIKGWALMVCAVACCLHFLFRPQRSAMFPFMLIAYGLGTALQTTSGRMESGWLSALTSPRYCTFTLTILWGIILYLPIVFVPAISRLGNARRLALAARLALSVPLCLAGIWLLGSLGRNLEDTELIVYPNFLERAHVLRTIDSQPDEAVRVALAPDVSSARHIAAILREKKLNIWAGADNFSQTTAIFAQPASLSHGETSFALNSLKIVSRRGQRWLTVDGWSGGVADKPSWFRRHLQLPIAWSRIAPDGTLSQSVWLAVGSQRFPLFYGKPRRDVAAYFSVKTIPPCGFSGDINLAVLAEGSHPLAIDVVDNDGRWSKHDTGAVLTCADGDCFLSVAGAKTDIVEVPAMAEKLTDELAPPAFNADNAIINVDNENSELVLWGWAYDPKAHLPMKRGWLDMGNQRVPLIMGGKRSDVRRVFGSGDLLFTGFAARAPLAGLAAGSYPLHIEMVGRTGLNLYRGDSGFILTSTKDGTNEWTVQRIDQKDSQLGRENAAPADDKPDHR